jgi:hypothetical protein
MLYLYGLDLKDNEFRKNEFLKDTLQDDRRMTLIAIETDLRLNKTAQKESSSPPFSNNEL